MADIQSVFLYISLFISLFFEVFLLITYLETREEMKFEEEHGGKNLKRFPSTTVIVPCWNEEKTIRATIESILALDYPREKLSLILVDDGSKDGTLELLNSYQEHDQVRVFTKPNGGKYSALNFALKEVKTELVGCLDADSFVNADALRKIAPFFEDGEIMAVTPAIKIHEPKTLFQYIQKTEYYWGIFLRKMLASINALYVTPGPFSIFRTQVLREIGGYRHAHSTEDLELALRMQKHRYKIANSHSAHVYTVAPVGFTALFRQRVRWTYGFLNNALDYKELFFNRKYGHIGMLALPVAAISIFSTLFAVGNLLWRGGEKVFESITKFQAVGFQWKFPSLSFDWFFLNTGVVSLLAFSAVLMTITILVLSIRLSEGEVKFDRGTLLYLTVYIFVVPTWILKAVWNTITGRQVRWR